VPGGETAASAHLTTVNLEAIPRWKWLRGPALSIKVREGKSIPPAIPWCFFFDPVQRLGSGRGVAFCNQHRLILRSRRYPVHTRSQRCMNSSVPCLAARLGYPQGLDLHAYPPSPYPYERAGPKGSSR
jgi:hypothetical protein